MSELPTSGGQVGTAMSSIQLELDAAIRSAEREMQRVDRNMTQIRSRDQPLTDEQVRAIEKLAAGPTAPREWDAVRTRIARGELTWRDIAEGRVSADPEVAAALHASIGLGKPQQPQSTPGDGVMPPTGEPRRSRPASRRDAWDDEDFSNADYFE